MTQDTVEIRFTRDPGKLRRNVALAMRAFLLGRSVRIECPDEATAKRVMEEARRVFRWLEGEVLEGEVTT